MNVIALVPDVSSAEYKIGLAIGSVFWLSVITVFVVSIVRFRLTKKGSWLGAMAVTGFLLLVMAGNFVFGLIHAGVVVADHRKDQSKLVGDRVVKSLSGKVSIKLPEKWKKQDGLNDLAGIQMLNTEKEEYLIVLEIPKDEFAGDFELFETFTAAETEDLMNGERMSETKKSKLGSMDMIQREVVDRGVWYQQTVLEGKERYYKILAWADSSHKEQSYNTFEQILASFEE